MPHPTYLKLIVGEELIELVLENTEQARDYMTVTRMNEWLPEITLNKHEFVPALFPGIVDVDTDDAFSDVFKSWVGPNIISTVLVAGQRKNAHNRYRLNQEHLEQLLPKASEKVRIYSQIAAHVTPDQAGWLCDMVEELSIEAVALRTPWFHTPRAYLTVVQEMKRREKYFVLLPWGRLLEPRKQYKLAGFIDSATNLELLPGEFQRLVQYVGTGDVANSEVFQHYLKWLEDNLK